MPVDAAAIRDDLFGGKVAPPPPPPENTTKAVVPGAVSAALQGLSFGFSDEATAYLRSVTTGTPYRDAVAAERQNLDKFRQDNPITAFGLEVAGAVPTMFVPMGWAGRAIQAARAGRAAGATATALGRVGVSAGTGAAVGGLAGFGAGEGDPLDRLTSALSGAAVGGIAGGTMDALARVSPRLAGEIAAMFREPPPADQARALIEKALRADGVTADRVLQMLNAGPRQNMTTAADVAGPTTRGLANSAANIPGEGRGAAEAFLNERGGAAAQRIRTDAAQLLGAQGDYFTTVEAIAARQRAAANDLYRAAYATDPIPTKDIADLVIKADGTWDPVFLQAYRKGYDIVERDARRTGEQPPPVIDLKSNPTAIPVQMIDMAKRGVDDRITTLYKAGKKAEATSLKKWKDALVARADALSPEYAAARNAFAGDAALLNAAQAGREFLTARPMELARQVQDMTQSELDAFRLGVMDSLGEALDKGRDGADQVRRIFGSPERRAQLRVVFPTPAAFAQFEQIMSREASFAETRHALLGNTQTAVRLEGGKQLTAPTVVPDTSNIVGKVVGALRSTDTNQREAVAREVVQALVRPNPARSSLVATPTNPRLAAVARAGGRNTSRAVVPAVGLEAGNLFGGQ